MNDERKSSENGRTNHAPIAATSCHPDEVDGVNIAQTPAEQKHTTSVKKQTDLTFSTTKHQREPNAICQFCDEAYHAKRPKQSKYCSPNCRRSAWLERNPERAKEIAEADKARLKAHIEARGGTWYE